MRPRGQCGVTAAVSVTRLRHPLLGQTLPVLGRLRRHGRVELLVVLPDGSKSFLPADWTSAEPAARGETAGDGTVGSVADLLAAHELAADLLCRLALAGEGGQAARQSSCEEDSSAACAAQSDTRGGPDATDGGAGRPSRRAGRGRDRVAGSPDRQDRRGGRGRAGGEGGR